MKHLKKTLFNSKRNKDNRLLLCLITVIVTAMTLFVSINALVLLEESMKQDLRQTTVGHADLVIQHTNSELFELSEILDAEILSILGFKGTIISKKEEAWSYIWGVEYKDFLSVFGSTFNKTGDVNFPEILTDRQVIVAPKVINKLGLSNGSMVELSLYGKTIELEVVCAPVDNYFVKSNDELIVVNKNVLSDLLDLGQEEMTLAYLFNVENKALTKEQLIKQYPSLDVKEAIDPEYISGNMTTYYGVEMMIFIFILLVAHDIMKSTGRIFVTEKAKQIGKLRSVGMTKTQLIKLYKSVGVNLGLKGTGIAVVIGTIGIFLFSALVVGLSQPLNGFDPIYFIVALVVTFAIMVLMSSRSFKVPVKKLLKKTDLTLLIEDVSAEIKYEKEKPREVIFLPVLLIIIILLHLNLRLNMAVTLLMTCIMYFSLYKSVKYLFAIVANRFKRTLRKGTGLIAFKNASGNIYLRKTLNLTMIISLFIIIIGVLIFSVLNAMTSFYKDYNADAFIRLEDGSFTDEELTQLKAIDGVTNMHLYYSGSLKIKTKSGDRKVNTLGLNDPIVYDKEFVHLHLDWLEDFDAAEFKNGHYTIVSDIIMNRFNLKLGDEIVLDDGKMERTYKIVASTSSLQELGDQIYISRFDPDFANGTIINGIYLQSNKMEILYEKVSDIFYKRIYRFKDVTQMRENDMTNGMQIILFFVSFATLVALTSITGIYSNYKLSYIMRKKEFAILGSVGYTRRHILSILLKEIVLISILGYLMGITILLLIKRPLELTLSYVELPIELQVNPMIFSSLLIIVVILMLINMALAIKSSQMINDSLIEEIKR